MIYAHQNKIMARKSSLAGQSLFVPQSLASVRLYTGHMAEIWIAVPIFNAAVLWTVLPLGGREVRDGLWRNFRADENVREL